MGRSRCRAAVLAEGARLDLPGLRDWCREKLSSHKIPQRLLFVTALPRNAMGKVTKPALRKLFQPAGRSLRRGNGVRPETGPQLSPATAV